MKDNSHGRAIGAVGPGDVQKLNAAGLTVVDTKQYEAMQRQSAPDFNAELERQRKATENAQALALHWQGVADRQRAQIDKLCEANIGLWSRLKTVSLPTQAEHEPAQKEGTQ